MGNNGSIIQDFGKLWVITAQLVNSQENIDAGHSDISLGFTGSYSLKMDNTQRVSIPSKFKEVLDQSYAPFGSKVVLLPDFEKIKVVPMPIWDKLKAQFEGLSSFDPDSDVLRTFIFGNMAICGLDAQNRIRLTPGLCDLAGLQKEVVFVGQQDRMEIWDAAKWKEFNANTALNLRNVMANVFRNQQTGLR